MITIITINYVEKHNGCQISLTTNVGENFKTYFIKIDVGSKQPQVKYEKSSQQNWVITRQRVNVIL